MENKILSSTAVLSFCILLLSVGELTAGLNKGASLTISLKEGQIITGELISVKNDSLILLQTDAGGTSVPMQDILYVGVHKPSRASERF
ncbi:MAG: hypothetical protein WBI18_01635 [Candidatus Saccharicenans sp.]